MTREIPDDAFYRKKYGAVIEIKHILPTADELKDSESFLELAASAVGIQEFMWKSKRGILIAVIVIPATMQGLTSFWGPVISASYEFARPYVQALNAPGIKLDSQLVVFGGSQDSKYFSDKLIIAPSSIGSFNLEGGDADRIYSGTVWRLAKSKYEPLNTHGAKLESGRFNKVNPGSQLLYASQDPLTAILALVSMVGRPEIADAISLRLHEIELSGTVEYVVNDPSASSYMVGRDESQNYGANWLSEERSSILAFNSIELSDRYHFLINLAGASPATAALVSSTDINSLSSFMSTLS